MKQLLIYTSTIVILILIIFSGLQCTSADKNITSTDYGCVIFSQPEIANKMSLLDKQIVAVNCCLKGMSSKTGSDSKDAVCKYIIDDLGNHFKEERKKQHYIYCFEKLITKKNETIIRGQKCWDKIK